MPKHPEPGGKRGPGRTVIVDGGGLTVQDVVDVATGEARAVLGPGVPARMEASLRTITAAVEGGSAVYGVNTGFGALADTAVSGSDLDELQLAIIRSHAAGTGEPLDDATTRAMLLLRARTLAAGYSGVRPELPRLLIEFLNRGLLPVVPGKGSVGASGDLAQLAHLAQPLIGEGRLRRSGGAARGGVDGGVDGGAVGDGADGGAPRDGADGGADGGTDGDLSGRPAAEVLSEEGLEPLRLAPKEGLALVNGTEPMQALLAFAVHDAAMLVRTADVACALSVEALLATDRPYDERVQALRPHPGQLASAANLRALLAGSELMASHRHSRHAVQDAYCLRCAPQVHGAVRDVLGYAERVVSIELASVVDNPVIVPGGVIVPDGAGGPGAADRAPAADRASAAPGGTVSVFHPPGLSGPTSDEHPGQPQGQDEKYSVMTTGNFHGEPLAFAADMLAIALAELASISERRVDRMLDPAFSRGLPPFLAPEAGINSGFMLAQYTAASLVSENKVLAHPASVDTIPTSGKQEDHVSMGWTAVRKLRDVVSNVRTCLAIEICCAAQGLDLRAGGAPGGSGPALPPPARPLRAVHAAVRSRVPPMYADREVAEQVTAVSRLLPDVCRTAAAECGGLR